MVVRRWGDGSVRLYGEENVGEAGLHDYGKVEARLPCAVYLALEAIPPGRDSAKEVVERLAFDGEAPVARHAVVACLDVGDMCSDERGVEVPRRLLLLVYGYLEHR